MFMVPKPKNTMISILFILFNIILFIYDPSDTIAYLFAFK